MTDDLRDELLEAIGKVISKATAETAVTVVRIIVDQWRQSKEGKVTPDQVRAEAARFLASIEANDSTADAELAAKFGKDK